MELGTALPLVKRTRRRYIYFACAACLLAGACISWRWTMPPREGSLSASFLGCFRNHDNDCASIWLTNRGTLKSVCRGTLSASSGSLEIVANINLTLPGHAGACAYVSIPPGTSPVQLTCRVDVVRQHPAWVRAIGALLDKGGIHLSHVRPKPTAMLQLQLGPKRTTASLSDYLTCQSLTNQWVVSRASASQVPRRVFQ